MIPVNDIKLYGNEIKYITDCVNSKWVSSSGKYVNLLESTVSQYYNREAIACSSGTAGLYTALKVLDISIGDEVIIPDFTIIVSANVVKLAGAKPVLVDVFREDYCIDYNKIEENITEKTKAIMVVHMYGNACNMHEIQRIAKKYNLYIIEDCCQSIGTKFDNNLTGTYSDIAVVSLYANKLITSGEGGIILTKKKEISEKIRLFINNGFTTPRFLHSTFGFNFRLSSLNAAFALAQFENVEKAIKRKREIAEMYLNELYGCKSYALYSEKKMEFSTYWMFSIVLNNFQLSRDEIMFELKNENVETRAFFYPISSQPLYKEEYSHLSEKHSNSNYLSKFGFYLPTGTGTNSNEFKYVIKILKNLHNKYSI